MDSFNAIPIFVAVAKHGGFTAAARELGLSKSAISKRITQLEDQLASRLIHRTTRKLSLTEAGERYYQHALKATIAAQNAEDSVSELLGDPQGVLKVHAPMSFGLLHIAPMVPLFLKHYPNVKIELMMDDDAIDIIGEGFDISIRPGELPDSTLISRRIASLKSMVCMSPDYATNTELTSPVHLEEENCLLYSYSSSAAYWDFNKSGKSKRVNVKGNYRVNSSEALKEAILQGAGIGRLPSFVAGEYIRTGKLIQIFSEYTMPEKVLYAVYPERNYVPAKVKTFIDFCIKYYGQKIPYWDKDLFND
jgi:DNA-binding transcriptional LysR family regulator